MEYFALAVLLMLFAIFCYGLFLSTSDDFVDSETLQILADNSNLNKRKPKVKTNKGEIMKLKDIDFRVSPFSILIDNTHKDDSFIRYSQKYFKNKNEVRKAILNIIESSNQSNKKIGFITFYYNQEAQFHIHFNDENLIEYISASTYFNPQDFVGNLGDSYYSFSKFISPDEILLEEKKKFLKEILNKEWKNEY